MQLRDSTRFCAMQYDFVRPYGATSLREYFACAFQEYYLGNKDRLFDRCPEVYKKIDEHQQILVKILENL